MKHPTVSVCILTYQHVGFIARAIDGALMQRRQAPFLEDTGCYDQPNRLNVIEPFKVRVTKDNVSHRAHPDTGQR